MGTVPSGGDYEYDLAHDVPDQGRPTGQRPQQECAPPVHGGSDRGTDLGNDYAYDEAHGG